MSDALTNREIASVITRLKSHTIKQGPMINGDIQETVELLERLQRKISQLEKAVEAAYAESETEQGEA